MDIVNMTTEQKVTLITECGFTVSADRDLEYMFKRSVKKYNRELDLLMDGKESKNPKLRTRVLANLEGRDIESELSELTDAVNVIAPTIRSLAEQAGNVAESVALLDAAE